MYTSLPLRFVLGSMLLIVFLLPAISYAQQTELQATIRGAILSDPRTSGLSQTQIDSIVSVLAQEAEKQGITPEDIQWRPQGVEQFASGETVPAGAACTGGFLCTMSEAFGFVGADTTIPFTLGAASMGLVWILAEMIHRRRHPVAAPASASPTSI